MGKVVRVVQPCVLHAQSEADLTGENVCQVNGNDRKASHDLSPWPVELPARLWRSLAAEASRAGRELSSYSFSLLRAGTYALYRGICRDQDPVLLVLPSDSRGSANCLEHEYSIRAELDSSWAAKPLAFARCGGRSALLLQDPGGEPLDKFLGQPLDTSTVLRIAVAVSAALRRVHEQGLIHKDIKPANLLVDAAGDGRAWISGFGIAGMLPREQQLPRPPEVIAGTLAYMSPEQTGRMNRSIDMRSDLYALGVTLYELLTGTLPFSATDPVELIHCHIARQPTAPSSIVGSVPIQLSTIVMKLLAKTAEERYQTAAGLETDLRHCLSAWEKTGQIEPFPIGIQDASHHLLIPEKLYGRENEVSTLLAAFDDMAKSGQPSLVLVSGYSGIGKSSVVNELHKVIVLPRGIFVSGKFDQRMRDIPYATLAQAFQGLVRQILTGGETEIRNWRASILQAVGSHGILLTDLIPELIQLIGDQPQVPIISPSEAQLRLQTVFQRFVSVFARAEHPLVIFVDDLQWLDPATLVLVEYLMTSPDTQYLLLIGAYRDNEVNFDHSLMSSVDVIRKSGVPIHELVLTPLSVEHINQLLCDALRHEKIEVRPLARLVSRKTGGNPFFVVQFLTSLAEEGLLKFDAGSRSWHWDLDGIEGHSYTENLVNLMISRLRRLAPATQEALTQLACLGSHVDHPTLAMVHRGSEAILHASFRAAAYAGMIYSRGEEYRFLHDRIQEAAYALMPTESRAECHLQIARRFLSGLTQQEIAEKIFDIVNHLNRGATVLVGWAEKEEGARLNLQAGLKAKASLAYVSASSYLSAGLAILGEQGWVKSYELTHNLCFELADCGLLCSDFDGTERRISEMLSKSRNPVERAEAFRMKVVLLLMQGQNAEAIETAFSCLQMFGLSLPEQPTEHDVEQEYEALLQDLGGRSIESLLELPLMQNAEMLVVTNVLERIGLAAYFHAPLLSHLIACRSARLGLQHGNNEFVTLALSGVGLMSGPILGHYEDGERFCRVAVECAERHGFPAQVGANVTLQMALIWTGPLGRALDHLERAIQIAEATGEVLYSCIAKEHRLTDLIAKGDALHRIWQESSISLAFVERVKFRQCIDIILSTRSFISALRSQSTERTLVDGSDIAGNPRESEVPVAVCFDRILQLQRHYLLGNPSKALELAEDVKPLLVSARPHIQFVDYCLYHSLALAEVLPSATPQAQIEYRQDLAKHLRTFEQLAKLCPDTFLHKTYLVAAEISRIEGRDVDAMRLYESAIHSSTERGFVQDQGVSNEAAFRFYLARGFGKVAQTYLREARDCYLRWGALAKVEQLERAHPELARLPGQWNSPTIETPVGDLDIAAVVRMSQAVASEIVLEKLIEKLLVIAMEHAGADRGILILTRDLRAHFTAEAKSGIGAVSVNLFSDPTAVPEYPAQIVQLVLHSGEAVILDDARRDAVFASDPYIRAKRIRSLLCLPLVKQGTLIGIVYLENRLASHAFTPARTEVLKLLSSQAAISLENARLYSDLVQENRDRKRAEEALRTSEASLSEAQRLSHTGSWRWNPTTEIFSASAELYRILGYDPATSCLNQTRFMARILIEDRSVVERMLGVAAQDRKRFQCEYRIGLPDGTIKHLQSVIQPEINANGEVDFVGTAIDITERRRAEETLRDTQSELTRVARLTTMGELVASMAHEVNQPLAAIVTHGRACFNWLSRDVPDLEEARSAAARVERDAQRAGEVIRGLRALATKSGLNLVALDVDDVIREVLVLTHGELQRHGIALHVDLAANGVSIRADRVQLQQVMLNLTMNAIEAMATTEQPKKLSIVSRVNPCDGVQVSVSDTGIGFENSVAARVFEPFFTTKESGMGMGLAICRSIIESHRGRLWAEPNVPRGATFRFALPTYSGVDQSDPLQHVQA